MYLFFSDEMMNSNENRDDVDTLEKTNIETYPPASTTITTITTTNTSTTTVTTTTTVQSQSGLGVPTWTGIGKTSTTELPSNGKEKKIKLTESNLEQFEMESSDDD